MLYGNQAQMKETMGQLEKGIRNCTKSIEHSTRSSTQSPTGSSSIAGLKTPLTTFLTMKRTMTLYWTSKGTHSFNSPPWKLRTLPMAWLSCGRQGRSIWAPAIPLQRALRASVKGRMQILLFPSSGNFFFFTEKWRCSTQNKETAPYPIVPTQARA